MNFHSTTYKFGVSRLPRLGFAATLAFFISLSGRIPPVTAAADLIPHQVLYRMKLGTETRGSGIADAEGVMAYSFRDNCGSWSAETRVKLRIFYTEGHDVDIGWSFASWEAKDGLAYSFSTHRRRDGEVFEVLKGKVARSAPGAAGAMRFSIPEGKIISLPEGTLFPTRHLLDLFAASERGEPIFHRTVFDGASLDNPYKINVVIARAGLSSKVTTTATLELAQVLAAGGLDPAPVRHMRMAFFPIKSSTAEPEFEVDVDYRADGIANRIRQDFGDFTIDLILDKIKMLKRPIC